MFKKQSPLSIVLLVLIASALACSLTRDKGEEDTGPQANLNYCASHNRPKY